MASNTLWSSAIMGTMAEGWMKGGVLRKQRGHGKHKHDDKGQGNGNVCESEHV